MIGEWLHAHPEEHDRWKERADQITAGTAGKSHPAGSAAGDAVAIDRLAQMLSSDFHEQMPLKGHSMYRDLLLESLSDVNWEQLAEELIRE